MPYKKVNTKSISLFAAVTLAAYPIAAHAQNVPIWLVAGVVSPLLAFLLCGILGLLAKSSRTAGRHAIMILIWIILFSLASYFVENDYVIWTPLILYILHSVLLVVLIAVQIIKRFVRNGNPV